MDHIYPLTLSITLSLKCERDWDDNDKKLAQLNTKVMNVLYYALGVNEFNKISICSSAKEI